jgi:hypothetical protein
MLYKVCLYLLSSYFVMAEKLIFSEEPERLEYRSDTIDLSILIVHILRHKKYNIESNFSARKLVQNILV